MNKRFSIPLDDVTCLQLWYKFTSLHSHLENVMLPEVVLVNSVEVKLAPFLSLIPYKSKLFQIFQLLFGTQKHLHLDVGNSSPRPNKGLTLLLNHIDFSLLTSLSLVRVGLDLVNFTPFLTHLTSLTLSNNCMRTNPTFIASLTRLVNLVIQHNPKDSSNTWDTNYLLFLSHHRKQWYQRRVRGVLRL
eukprot:TRINITY_DN3497_c0_g1_i7.p1 TRINITY_DN3497_c0_g1~~TRINITY_DN3497_c0_g1_i7.p1  ORF type:complete len:195 (+),score=39.30 TRINITY_DN3497_c0_g1_i7:22-585(+)